MRSGYYDSYYVDSDGHYYYHKAEIFENDATSLDWGFGQVTAILLLLAPLVTLFQCFFHGIHGLLLWILLYISANTAP